MCAPAPYGLLEVNLYLIDDDFRNDIRNQSLFIEIIKQPNSVGHKLRMMHRYGVLGAYMPTFAAIEGQMQFDLFHIYTVDEHILTVIQNLRLIWNRCIQRKVSHLQWHYQETTKTRVTLSCWFIS